MTPTTDIQKPSIKTELPGPKGREIIKADEKYVTPSYPRPDYKLVAQKGAGVWLEDADAVMVTGIENGLDASLQRATTGMSQWLRKRYGLSDSEIALLLSASIEYDIAEIVDPRPNVVARIAKSTLAMLKPQAP